MSVNKLSESRIMRLLAMLKAKRYPRHRKHVAFMRKPDEADAFNSSSKTVQRDIEYRNVDYRKHGSYPLDPEWTFDVSLLSETDMISAVIGAGFAGFPLTRSFAGQMRPALNKLLPNKESACDNTAALFALNAAGTKVPFNPLARCRIGRSMRLPVVFEIDRGLEAERNACKLFSLETVKDVVLTLYEGVFRFAQENFPPDAIRHWKSGGPIVKIPEAVRYMLFGFILSMPEKVTVLASDFLHKEVRNGALELMRMHPDKATMEKGCQ